MTDEKPMVFILDDDADVRRSVARLVGSVGLRAETFGSIDEFWREADPARASCLVLDMRLPERSGLDLLQELATKAPELPVIMITAFGDVPSAVRAMRSNAFDFLQKPFNDQTFLDTVQRALRQCQQQRAAAARAAAVRARLATLSQRERQVMELVVAGNSNKMVASALSLSLKTAENYRANLMKKMGARSLAELVHLSLAADQRPGPAS